MNTIQQQKNSTDTNTNSVPDLVLLNEKLIDRVNSYVELVSIIEHKLGSIKEFNTNKDTIDTPESNPQSFIEALNLILLRVTTTNQKLGRLVDHLHTII
jgi:hypothetical protein